MGCDAIVHVVVFVRAGKGEGWTLEVSMIGNWCGYVFEAEKERDSRCGRKISGCVWTSRC